MHGDADIASAAALLAEPARAALVTAVIADGELAATDLAARAGIAASTASEHLARLVAGGFLRSAKHGRHRCFRLADPAVAAAVEALAVVAPQPPVRSLRDATRSELLREARTCYDHLAGRIGVALAASLERDGTLVRGNGGYELGSHCGARLGRLGVDLAALEGLRRPVVRGCLDWSERELHVAGGLGAALANRFFELGWIERRDGNRSVDVTAPGRRGFSSELGIELGKPSWRAAKGVGSLGAEGSPGVTGKVGERGLRDGPERLRARAQKDECGAPVSRVGSALHEAVALE